MGRTIRMKKSPNHTEPYALFYIFSTHQPFVTARGWRYVLADRHPNAAVPYESTPASLHIITYPCRMGQSLRINSPYLTYAYTMFTYQPYTVARMNFTIFMAIRTPQSEHEPYQSNGDTFDTNPLRIIQTTFCTL